MTSFQQCRKQCHKQVWLILQPVFTLAIPEDLDFYMLFFYNKGQMYLPNPTKLFGSEFLLIDLPDSISQTEGDEQYQYKQVFLSVNTTIKMRYEYICPLNYIFFRIFGSHGSTGRLWTIRNKDATVSDLTQKRTILLQSASLRTLREKLVALWVCKVAIQMWEGTNNS